MKILICFIVFMSIFISTSTKACNDGYRSELPEEVATINLKNAIDKEGTAPRITDHELLQDLLMKDTVRYQIAAALNAQNVNAEDILTLLAHPLICIGTGKRREALKLKHIRPTYVREQDFTIDFSQVLQPDFVGDAFSLAGTELPRLCGAVYFAHVGFGWIDDKPKTQEILKTYFNHLIRGGYFIYISEVPYNAKHINKAYDLYRSHWISQLDIVGFKNIKVFIKDESAHYMLNAQSLVVIAQK